MQIGGDWSGEPITDAQERKAFDALDAALEAGISFFDHADIYCRGKSEEVFGAYLAAHPGLRETLVIQSKCGIRMGEEGDGKSRLPTRFDFSYDHIMRSVEGILSRLSIDYLDLLLLHRPDPLVEPEEVARAFSTLREEGKVRQFGVSNQSAPQIRLLEAHLDVPIVTNQMEVSLLHPDLLVAGTAVNQREPDYPMRDEGTLEYCRERGITLQAWAPLAKGLLTGAAPPDAEPRVRSAASLVAELADAKGVRPEAVALAWVLRHPAPVLPVVGSTNPQRIAASAEALEVDLSRDEWYLLLEVARGIPMP